MDRKCVKRVILTRSAEDIEKDRKLFESIGFEVVPLPLIKTEPVEFEIPDINFDWIVFQSVKAVLYFLRKASVPCSAKIAVVGEKTRKILEEKGFSVSLVPSEHSAEGIVKAFPLSEGRNILLPRAEEGREEVISGLKEKGYNVVPLTVYRTTFVLYPVRKVEQLVEKGGFIVFASPSAVKGFFANVQEGKGKRLLNKCVVVAIGKTTKGELESRSISPLLVPTKPLMEEVAGKIHSFWQENCTY